VGGNERLYRDLLVKFAAKNVDADLQIAAALKSEDRPMAERIAHTVKGVAGNLGIKRVQGAAEKLERAIHESDAGVSMILQDFTSLLRPQIEAIQQALKTTAAPTLETASKGSFDIDAVSREVQRLRRLLLASDGDSEETLRTLQGTLAGRVEKAQLDALACDISEFDFTGALLKLDDIVKENGLNREEVRG
jgi:HPt (histidine-containing phosphotransfer) domain-containing protein